jgi:hypothetical protein
MEKLLSSLSSVVDNIPKDILIIRNTKIVVSEHIWDCIVDELKEYKAHKDQINDDFTVDYFIFEGIKIESSKELKGYDVHVVNQTSL